MGCHFLLQGIFPIQGSNPGLPHCRQTLYRLSHQGSPYIYWWLLNLDVELWLLLRTLMYNCLLHISIWILNRHLRHYMVKTKLLIFSLQTCFSCTTTDYVSYFSNVEFIFDFSLFISRPNLLACSVFKIPISIASLHLHYFNSNIKLPFFFLIFYLNYFSSLINVLWPPSCLCLSLAHKLCTKHTVISTLKHSKLTY